MTAAYSLRENPRSMTNGAVMPPAIASLSLNRMTKTSATQARSRDRKSANAPTAASVTRCSRFSRAWAASALVDFSGSVAISVVTMPISTSAAIAA